MKEEHRFPLTLHTAVATSGEKSELPHWTDESQKYVMAMEKMSSLRNSSYTKYLYTQLPFIPYSRNISSSKKQPCFFLLLRLEFITVLYSVCRTGTSLGSVRKGGKKCQQIKPLIRWTKLIFTPRSRRFVNLSGSRHNSAGEETDSTGPLGWRVWMDCSRLVV